MRPDRNPTEPELAREHPDIQTIRKALYSGQLSALKVDAQRAFERVVARLHHQATQPDAHRIVQAAMVLAALPAICTPTAREDAATELRSVLSRHPSEPPLLRTIVEHLEK